MTALYVIVGIILAATVLMLLLSLRQDNGTDVLAYADSFEQTNGLIFGVDGKGKYVYSPVEAEGMCAIVGGTGSGKSSGCIIQSLRSCGASCGGLVLDLQGDLTAATRDHLPNSIVYDIRAQDKAYNVFAPIDAVQGINGISKEDLQEVALANLALQLMPVRPSSGDGAKYFSDGGRSFLTAGLIVGYFQGLDFVETIDYILQSSFPRLVHDALNSGRRTAIVTVAQYADIAKQNPDDKNVQGCKSSCDSAISLYSSDVFLRHNLRRPHPGETVFDASTILHRMCFVLVPEQDKFRYGPLIALIISQCLTVCKERRLDDLTPDGKKPVLLVLDELPAAGVITGLQDAIALLRKRKCRIIACWQANSQLRFLYSDQITSAMLSNMHFKLILDVQDIEEQKFWAETIGKHDIKKVSVSSSGSFGSNISTTTAPDKDYIIPPADFGRLLPDHPGKELGRAVLIYPGEDKYKELYTAYFWFPNPQKWARKRHFADHMSLGKHKI